MSDSWLRYIPRNPDFRPSTEAAIAAEGLLRAYFPDAESVRFEAFEDVQFMDAGGNWAGVACPSCGADAEPWWATAMSAAHKERFARLDVGAPCCGVATSLNDLHYGWPCGFGVFVIEALNPNQKGLAAEKLAALGAVIGHPLREVPRHL